MVYSMTTSLGCPLDLLALLAIPDGITTSFARHIVVGVLAVAEVEVMKDIKIFPKYIGIT